MDRLLLNYLCLSNLDAPQLAVGWIHSGLQRGGTSCAGWALPKAVKDWSLRGLQVKLIKREGRIVRHARRIVFQSAEVAVPGGLFAAILERISRLCLSPG
jgi:hypothetical protein